MSTPRKRSTKPKAPAAAPLEVPAIPYVPDTRALLAQPAKKEPVITTVIDQNPALARERWLAERRQRITGTDMAAILGLSDFRTPMNVYLDKRGLSDAAENERMEWGNRLQTAILMGYADRTQQSLEMADPYRLELVPDLPILGATLDARWADGDRRPVDAKNVGFRNPAKWGEDGSDQIPEAYIVQLHVQMAATAAQVAELAVLFGGHRMAVYRVHRDAGLLATIYEEAERFYKRHVLGGVEPAIDGSKAWSEHLAKTYRKNTEVMVKATPDAAQVAEALHQARTFREEAEETEEALVNRMKALIGENAGIVGEGWKVTWRLASGSTKTDWKAVAAHLHDQLRQVAGEGVYDLDAIAAAHVTTSVGSRRFLPVFASKKGDE